MGNYNGVDIAAIIKRYCPEAIIVFTTTSRDFAIDAFSVRAFDYLLKPLDQSKVFECLKLMLNSLSSTPKTMVQIKTKDHSIAAIEIKDISYIESLNRRLLFHKKDGNFIETTSLRTKFLESIPFDYQKYNFVTCHVSFVVNLNYIKSITDKYIILKDNTNIPISKAMYQDVKKQYIKFLVGD